MSRRDSLDFSKESNYEIDSVDYLINQNESRLILVL